ncbi:phosphatase PAP2 family protein [Streptomyces sp. NPDC096136]|uniref:phosphatase PAP2 family protein n=1 Tax=Streptomyces sp. NPDC096136 TaxID=3366076 RepID=UPI00380005C0
MLRAVAVTVPACVPFALVLVLVEARWAPLGRLDRGAAGRLHAVALADPGWVRFLDFLTHVVWDPVTMRLLVAALVVWLLLRGAVRLALWAAVTAMAGGLLGALAKGVVARARPDLPDPVSHAPGFAFPSGHAMTATTSCAVLLLVLLPLAPRRRRPLLWVLAVVSVVGVGYTRVALGVHWVSDVLGGWLLGLALVSATAVAFGARRASLDHARETRGEPYGVRLARLRALRAERRRPGRKGESV